MNKKTVLVLVIIALVLAGLSIAVNLADSGKEVKTEFQTQTKLVKARDSGSGRVGVEVAPLEVEDRG